MLADDHVMWDTPATLAGAARTTQGRRLTIAENVVKLRSKYREFFTTCQQRNIEIIVALEYTFRRIPLKRYITERAILWHIGSLDIPTQIKSFPCSTRRSHSTKLVSGSSQKTK